MKLWDSWGQPSFFVSKKDINEVSALTMLEYGVIHQCQKGTAGDGLELKWIGKSSHQGLNLKECEGRVS